MPFICEVCGYATARKVVDDICPICLGIPGGSQESVPAGGWVASGAVAEPVGMDGVSEGTGLTLKKVHGFEGDGWYLNWNGEDFIVLNILSDISFGILSDKGDWWKIGKHE